jgi:glycosyltransferase involved in cell wall biosynthesis
MNVLLWHVHGSWTTAFVQGRHEYLVPVLADRGAYGLGRARSWQWPASVREVSPAELRRADVDAVVLQRPAELELAGRWLGRRVGRDVPAVYVEHNTPECVGQRHEIGARSDIPLVHVTHFNQLCWDSGRARSVVVEHGIVDPGERYTGELARTAVVVNDAGRRGRTVGADLIPVFAQDVPVDLFGMGSAEFAKQHSSAAIEPHDLVQAQLHSEMARRRVYLHTTRWTSLGLSLLEAMHLGMPVVVLATTAATEAVTAACGALSTDVDQLRGRLRELMNEPELARLAGKTARAAAVSRYGLDRFLDEWDDLLEQVAGV